MPGRFLTKKALQIAPNLQDYLMAFTSVNNKIFGKKLGAIWGVSDITVRAIVNHLRQQGARIGSDTNKKTGGYWWAQTEEELDGTKDDLRGRIIGIQLALNGLNKSFEVKSKLQQVLFG